MRWHNISKLSRPSYLVGFVDPGVPTFPDIHFAVLLVKKNVSLLSKILHLVSPLALANCWAF